MGCGVVDLVRVGERLNGVVSAKVSAKLWSRGYESQHHVAVT
jgi:hypothetical protein